MSVYVDDLFTAVPRGAAARRCGTRWCHMMADSPEELHAFAASLGLKRSWAQHEGRRTLHYDLVPSKRKRALELGAVPIDMKTHLRKLMGLGEVQS